MSPKMTEKRQLRAVEEGETAPPRRKAQRKTLKAAAEVSERDLLLTMRDKVAVEIDNGVPSHTLAPLMRQLRDIDKEIRLLDLRLKQEAEESGSAGGDEVWDATAI